MEEDDVADVPEDGLSLGEDAGQDMGAGLQMMRRKVLHLLHKLLLPVHQALDQLAEDIAPVIIISVTYYYTG